MLAPTLVGKILQVPIAAHSTAATFLRLFGVRDAALGELTWTVKPQWPSAATAPTGSTQHERAELRRILWAGVAVDVLDVATVAYVYARGGLPRFAAGLYGGAALAFAGLGLVGLRGL